MERRYLNAIIAGTAVAVLFLVLGCQSAAGTLERQAAGETPVTVTPASQSLTDSADTELPTPTKHRPYADIDFPTPTPPAWFAGNQSGSQRRASQSEQDLISLKLITDEKRAVAKYDRDEYGYGADQDGNCRYARHEVLVDESATPAQYETERGCKVAAGEWTDPWTGQKYTNPGGIHIDHHVPLRNAHYSGADAWTPERKAAFSNDLALPASLNAVSVKTNLDKGYAGPDQWQPENTEFHCRYAEDWIAVKSKWDLAVTASEKRALHQMLLTCP